MAPKPKAPTSPTTTVPEEEDAFEKAIKAAREKAASRGGSSYVPAGSVSPSTRSPIGVEGTQTLNPLTGEPTGYFGYTTSKQLQQLGGFEPGGQVVTSNPKYFSGDEDSITRFSTEQIANIQYQLSKNGLMSRKYTPGVVDNTTRSGFRELLGIANREGIDWGEALGVVNKAMEGAGTGKVQAYQMTNPDDLKVVFRKAAQEMLGRNLQDGDLNRLVQTFQQQEVAYQKQAALGGEVTATPSPTTFAERNIEKDFGKEVNLQKMENIFKSIDQALTGGQ